MKKVLIFAAAVCACWAARAQSSVTLFGIVDATLTYGTASGAGSSHRWQLASSGYNASRLGLRGQEDLGGGLSAGFWLEAGMANDNGAGLATNTNNQASGAAPAPLAGAAGLTFNRRSTVSLSGNWGELRLGRDYTPQIWNLLLFDPFGALGAGAAQPYVAAINGVTQVRASNSVGYFLPANLGGIYGQAQAYLGENPRDGANTERDGDGAGVRVGYAAGPLDVALAASRTRYAAGDVRQNNLALKWQIGPARLLGVLVRDRNATVSGNGFVAGAIYAIGAGELRAAFSRYATSAAGSPAARKFSLGYVYNLSKQTALYTTVAHLKNRGSSKMTINGAVAGGLGESSTGFDLGIRRSF
ncbi:porin [Ramlibacter sp. AN1133]|uniref:porin n=1 Tax=Ramlibacter sp. AN1133 TaxID=3133429 RepID=UPI0030C57230